jgi:hypothetical protein
MVARQKKEERKSKIKIKIMSKIRKRINSKRKSKTRKARPRFRLGLSPDHALDHDLNHLRNLNLPPNRTLISRFAASRSLTIIITLLIWPGSAAAQLPEPEKVESTSGASSSPHLDQTVPFSPADLEAAISRGTTYLCRTQNRDGSWGSPRWTGGVDQDPVPGAPHSFSVVTTALCPEALLKTGETTANNDAIAKAESFLFENPPKLRRPDQGNLPNISGYIYSVQALSELAHREPTDTPRHKRLADLIRSQIKGLEHFETVHGGWFYYASGFQRPLAPSASFVNAAGLVALDQARPLGLTMNDRVLKRAIKATADQRKPDSR